MHRFPRREMRYYSHTRQSQRTLADMVEPAAQTARVNAYVGLGVQLLQAAEAQGIDVSAETKRVVALAAELSNYKVVVWPAPAEEKPYR